MEKEKLVFKNGIEVDLETGASLGELKVVADSKNHMLATWELMTLDNLSQVQIKNSAGLTAEAYTDLVLAYETSVERLDGSILTTYSLRKKTAEERLSERIKALEETTDILTTEALMGGEPV